MGKNKKKYFCMNDCTCDKYVKGNRINYKAKHLVAKQSA